MRSAKKRNKKHRRFLIIVEDIVEERTQTIHPRRGCIRVISNYFKPKELHQLYRLYKKIKLTSKGNCDGFRHSRVEGEVKTYYRVCYAKSRGNAIFSNNGFP